MQPLEDEDDLVANESVERRGEPRGNYHGLRAVLREPPLGEVAVPDASRAGFFAELAHPDSIALGAELKVELHYKDRNAIVQVRVIRKELEPRHGIAVIISEADPADGARYRALLGIE